MVKKNDGEVAPADAGQTSNELTLVEPQNQELLVQTPQPLALAQRLATERQKNTLTTVVEAITTSRADYERNLGNIIGQLSGSQLVTAAEQLHSAEKRVEGAMTAQAQIAEQVSPAKTGLSRLLTKLKVTPQQQQVTFAPLQQEGTGRVMNELHGWHDLIGSGKDKTVERANEGVGRHTILKELLEEGALEGYPGMKEYMGQEGKDRLLRMMTASLDETTDIKGAKVVPFEAELHGFINKYEAHAYALKKQEWAALDELEVLQLKRVLDEKIAHLAAALGALKTSHQPLEAMAYFGVFGKAVQGAELEGLKANPQEFVDANVKDVFAVKVITNSGKVVNQKLRGDQAAEKLGEVVADGRKVKKVEFADMFKLFADLSFRESAVGKATIKDPETKKPKVITVEFRGTDGTAVQVFAEGVKWDKQMLDPVSAKDQKSLRAILNIMEADIDLVGAKNPQQLVEGKATETA